MRLLSHDAVRSLVGISSSELLTTFTINVVQDSWDVEELFSKILIRDFFVNNHFYCDLEYFPYISVEAYL